MISTVHLMDKLLELIDVFLGDKNLSQKQRFIDNPKLVSSFINTNLNLDVGLNLIN